MLTSSMENFASSEKPTAMSETTTKFRRKIGICRVAVIVLIALVIALLVVVIILALKLQDKDSAKTINGSKKESNESTTAAQTEQKCSQSRNTINLDPPAVLPPFHDLTKEEIKGVKDFLYKQSDLNLVRPDHIKTYTSYLYTMELRIPDKENVLNYLDKGIAQPEREARVVIFRGDKQEPIIDEYTVGPLPHPDYKKDKVTRPFRYRPFTVPEYFATLWMVYDKIHNTVGNILKESYGGSLLECGDKCLVINTCSSVSGASIGEPMSRKNWCWLAQKVEFHTLQNLDFIVLVDVTSNNPEEYTIDKVVYANQVFNSLEELKQGYEQGGFTKTKINFPIDDKELFSTMNRRGNLFPDEPLSPPEEFEPSGRRYSINGRHISYMEWDFDVRMSTISGPQVFDIRYHGRRIVYELSLQEIGVFYSAHNPAHRLSDIADSVVLIGARPRSLVPGVDCPKHATFLNVTHSMEYSEDPVTYPAAFCVFEHNTGMPLRRHLNSGPFDKQFYEGMVDIVLIVRTVATISNYDYIFDFVFHQNGAVEVKAVSTGYMLTSFRHPEEDEFGFRLKDHLTGNIHHHLFHFKVDMDINGRKNRFEVLEVTPVEVDNSQWSKEQNAVYSQTKLTKKEILREKEAALKYNFDTPKYLTFYNNDNKTTFGLPRAYRLFAKGISKQMYPENKGQEASFSWARYQVAVTKYKDTEKRSSSMYAIVDAGDPVVNFQSFIDDDEVISDQDQVAWVSLGIHHIPHMEDLPVTPTTGLALEFFLLPYNYFDEDPAMGSSDAVRIERSADMQGITVNRYGREEDSSCKPRKPTYLDSSSTYEETINKDTKVLFDDPIG